MTQLVWLVTGCSSGLGEAFVHSLLARGDKVIATGRNADSRLAHLSDTGATIFDLDVTASQVELDSRIQFALQIYGKIDVLVNNAGYIEMGFVEELSQQQLRNQLDTNLFGSINVTKAILPYFRKRKAGRIGFMNSIFGFTSMAAGGPYTISKHGLAGFSATLNDEVADAFDIYATLFEIGHFRTAVVGENAKMTAPKIEDYKASWESVEQVTAGIHGNQPGDPRKGVDRMIDVLKSEGMAKGKSIPRRVPVGADALQMQRAYAAEMLKNCDEWEELASSTDFEGPKLGFFAQ